MASSRTEYYSDQLKKVFAKTMKSPITAGLVAVTTAVGVPYNTADWMGGDPDRIGGEEREAFYTEMRADANALAVELESYKTGLETFAEQKKSLSAQIDIYDKLEDEGVYSEENALAKVDLLRQRDNLSYTAPEGLEGNIKTFLADIFTTGTANEPTLSEKDLETLLETVEIVDFNDIEALAGRDAAYMLSASDRMEHFDEAYADNLPIAKDLDTRFDAASEMVDAARTKDRLGTLGFVASLPGAGLLAWFLTFMLVTGAQESRTLQRWSNKRPEKPKRH